MIILETVIIMLLWCFLSAVLYAYLGYPMLIYCLATVFGRNRASDLQNDEDLPKLSLLVAAYNEEAVIEARIRNALAMDYPRDKLEIVVATDGCCDATASIVRRFGDRGVLLFEYSARRGKATVLNESVPRLTGEILMFSDANTYTEPDAAKKLVRWFRDKSVGAVCGRLLLTDSETGRNVDSLYWKYETFIKRQEGRLGALLGANGGLYAIRKEMYFALPSETILDDMIIPLIAKLRTGCDIIFEPAAVANEETAASVRAEFSRRSRIGAGGFGSLRLLAGLLDPRRGWGSFTFLSHKIMRWCCPFCLIGLVITNIMLAGKPFYLALLAAQAVFYITAVIAACIPSQQKPMKILRLTTMFASMNGALLIGFSRWLLGRQSVTWKRTLRGSELGAGKAVRPFAIELEPVLSVDRSTT